MLVEIETRYQASGQTIATAASKNGSTEESDGSLIDIGSRTGKVGKLANLHERGDDHLAKFLIVQQLFAEEEVNTALEAVTRLNKDLTSQALAASLLDQLCKEDDSRLETVLSALID